MEGKDGEKREKKKRREREERGRKKKLTTCLPTFWYLLFFELAADRGERCAVRVRWCWPTLSFSLPNLSPSHSSLPLSLILCSFQLVLLYSLIAFNTLSNHPSIALAFSSFYFFISSPHLVLLSSSLFFLSIFSLSLSLSPSSLNEWMDKKEVCVFFFLLDTREKKDESNLFPSLLFSSTGSNFELESQKERNSFEEEGELRVKRKLDPIIFSLPSFSSSFVSFDFSSRS